MLAQHLMKQTDQGQTMNEMATSPAYTYPAMNVEMELLSSIHSIAMYPLSKTLFQLIGKKPQWLDTLGDCTTDQQFKLNQPEGFLENFLVDAQAFWQSKSKGTLRSGKWIQTDSRGVEHPFEAIVSIIRLQPILLVQYVSDSYLEMGRILQSAREGAVHREKIENLAYRDDLTGLFNRRGFLLHGEERLLLARCKQHPVTVVCIDLDRLKRVNDNYGHKAGDQLIFNAAALFKKAFRKDDLLGRIGGDEFLALITNMSSAETTRFIARLRQTFDDWNARYIPDLQISFSIGLARDSAALHTLEQLIGQADKNMYKHKHSKYRNQ